MLAAYDPEARKLARCDTIPEAGWVHVTAPDEAERKMLVDAGVAARFLDHALDVDELARVDHASQGGTLVVVKVPDPTHKKRRPLRAVPFGVVIVDEKLCITIARCETHLQDRVIERDELDRVRPHRLLLVVLLAAAAEFLRQVGAIDEKVDRVEDRLQHSQENREVLELLFYQKSLVHLTTALGSNEIMLERLQEDDKIGFSAADRELLHDVVVEVRQAAEMTKVSEEILGSMMDAFASIISNNLNVVVKALTSLTIVLTFPALVASFYGMNVGLPLAEHPHAFKILLGISLALSGVVAWIFHRRKWL